MSAFDPNAIIRQAREGATPPEWQVLHLRRNAAMWDLFVRLVAGVALLAICAWLAISARGSGNSAAQYVFAAFALFAAATYLAAAWTPIRQGRHPDSYLLVVATDAVALDWSGSARGLPFAEVADVTLRRRSFRAIFGQDLILSRADGSEVALPIGELFGESDDILTAVISRTRSAHGLPAAFE
jgi:ABC-type transport system involved in cytochrome bd biosynthesis fused ATPase/permease subunit